MDFKKILAAVDFSPASVSALARAASLARSSGAELHVVHVVEALVYRGVQYVEPLGAEAHARHRAAAEKALTEAIATAGRDAARATRSIIEGEPRSAINRHAEEMDADLLVLGATGHGPLRELLLGSVSNHVAHTATCSVLLVRD